MSIVIKARNSLASGEPAVLVTVTKAEGSTPREAGAQMLVTARGFHGTIGGGTLEWLALAEAQSLLGKPQAIRTLTKSLGPDLGQCCGGRVTLRIETITETTFFEAEDAPIQLNLWGAGHVGRALVLALAPLPFKITWWDVRENAFPIVTPENTSCRLGAPKDMESGMVMVMTHSHSLDFEVVDYALRQSQFSHVGLIGSATKATRFSKRLTEAGHSQDALSRFNCPIGSKVIKSKLPAAIAASVVVQVLEWQELLKSVEISTQFVQSSVKV